MAYARQIQIPSQSFFLFGPRGTGKSTWLKQEFKGDLVIDLLKSETFLQLSADPSLVRAQFAALKPRSRVVIDEVQKLPQILDEVHHHIFSTEHSIQFALTGSSARRLKRANVNLLAGRAVNRKMYPLNSFELGTDFDIGDLLSFGSLPQVVNLKSKAEKIDYLSAYVENYLREEIQAEAAVRNLSSYHRFLKHTALINGQVMNLSNISREAAVSRSTLDGYFSILQDTLLGDFLEPIHLKAKVKEVSNPKFYFFDVGVVRALRNELGERVLDVEKGYLLENIVLNEMKSYSSYQQKYLEFYYWATPSQNEVDFIVSKAKVFTGIEVKASVRWRSEFNKGLETLVEAKKINKAFGVYLGKEKLRFGAIEVWPFHLFLKEMHQGNLI
jgi:predicted AAA+ superfamily ATPase